MAQHASWLEGGVEALTGSVQACTPVGFEEVAAVGPRQLVRAAVIVNGEKDTSQRPLLVVA